MSMDIIEFSCFNKRRVKDKLELPWATMTNIILHLVKYNHVKLYVSLDWVTGTNSNKLKLKYYNENSFFFT